MNQAQKEILEDFHRANEATRNYSRDSRILSIIALIGAVGITAFVVFFLYVQSVSL